MLFCIIMFYLLAIIPTIVVNVMATEKVLACADRCEQVISLALLLVVPALVAIVVAETYGFSMMRGFLPAISAASASCAAACTNLLIYAGKSNLQ